MAAAPGNLAANRIPAAPSLVVSGLKLSASRVTEHHGSASATHTAVERPTTPAPTTATRTPFLILQEGLSRPATAEPPCYELATVHHTIRSKEQREAALPGNNRLHHRRLRNCSSQASISVCVILPPPSTQLKSTYSQRTAHRLIQVTAVVVF